MEKEVPFPRMIKKPALNETYPDFFRLGGDLSSGNAELGKGDSDNGTFGAIPIIRTAELNESNVVTSRLRDTDHHKVVIDLDMDAALIPSSTPGNHHLIVAKTLPWAEYQDLLKALYAAGLIQKGYFEASVNRGASVIRTPWTKKETPVVEPSVCPFD